MWIFKDYFPARGGGCSGTSEPATFYNFLAYNNLKGFEVTNGGAIQTVNFTVLDNSEAGLEFTKVAGPWGHQGPLVKDCLVVGHSAVSGSSSACTQGGLVAPMSTGLTVSNTAFVNFDAPSCAALRSCSFCRQRQGGYSTKFEKIQFVNSPNKAAFKWEHESVLVDLDGTLTGKWTTSIKYEMRCSSDSRFTHLRSVCIFYYALVYPGYHFLRHSIHGDNRTFLLWYRLSVAQWNLLLSIVFNCRLSRRKHSPVQSQPSSKALFSVFKSKLRRRSRKHLRRKCAFPANVMEHSLTPFPNIQRCPSYQRSWYKLHSLEINEDHTLQGLDGDCNYGTKLYFQLSGCSSDNQHILQVWHHQK